MASIVLLIHRVANEAMQAPELLLDRIGEAPDATRAGKRLVVVMGQLGDFDQCGCIAISAPSVDNIGSPTMVDNKDEIPLCHAPRQASHGSRQLGPTCVQKMDSPSATPEAAHCFDTGHQ